MVTPYFLNLIAGNVMHSPSTVALPAMYYVALSTTVPTDNDGTGFAEVSGGAYTRGSFGTGSTPNNGLVTNANDVEYPECTANWGGIKAFGLYDAATGGHLLTWDRLKNEQSVVVGNQVRFKPGALKITFASDTGA